MAIGLKGGERKEAKRRAVNSHERVENVLMVTTRRIKRKKNRDHD